MSALTYGTAGTSQKMSRKMEVSATDISRDALVDMRAPYFNGCSWNRRVFWRKGEWFVFMDDCRSLTSGPSLACQTWITHNPAHVAGNGAISKAPKATLHIQSLPGTQASVVRDGAYYRAQNALYERNEGVRIISAADGPAGHANVVWTLLYAKGATKTVDYKISRLAHNAVAILPMATAKRESAIAIAGVAKIGRLKIDCDMGLLSAQSFTLLGCRSIELDGRSIFKSVGGAAIGWDLTRNRFQNGKKGVGLTVGASPAQLKPHCTAVARAISSAVKSSLNDTPRIRTSESPADGKLAVEVVSRIKLPPPPSLITAPSANRDLLALYTDEGRPRFSWPEYPGLRQFSPIVWDCGETRPRVVVPRKGGFGVYSWEGELLWSVNGLDVTPLVCATGDYDGDGVREMAVAGYGYIDIFCRDGKSLFTDSVFRDPVGNRGEWFNAMLFRDIDSDGRQELIAYTGAKGFVVFKQGEKSRFSNCVQSGYTDEPSYLAVDDFNSDGACEAIAAGGSTVPVCVSLSDMKVIWSGKGISSRPVDAAIFEGLEARRWLVIGGPEGFCYVLDPKNAAVALLAAPAAANLIVNGDFETPGSSPIGFSGWAGASQSYGGWYFQDFKVSGSYDWSQTTADVQGYWYGHPQAFGGRGGGQNGQAWRFSSAYTGQRTRECYEELTYWLPTIDPGSTVHASAWVYTGNIEPTFWNVHGFGWDPTDYAGLRVDEWDSSATVIASHEQKLFGATWTGTETDPYRQLWLPFTVDANTAYISYTLTFYQGGLHDVVYGTDVYNGHCESWATFDDLCVTVPEPGSILALCSGLFGLAGMAIRRRK